jgi:hypothetical protein
VETAARLSQSDPMNPTGSSMPVATGATSGSIHGQNAVAGTYVAGGTLNINFYDGGMEEAAMLPSMFEPRLMSPEPLAIPSPLPFASIPFPPDSDFIERPDITVWLSNKCRPGNRAALTGLGGVG